MAKSRKSDSAKSLKKAESGRPFQFNSEIKFVIPPGFPITYADQGVIQFFDDEFIISFFQTPHPVVQNEEDIERHRILEAQCVFRVVLRPATMARLHQAMSGNLEKFRAVLEQMVAEPNISRRRPQ